MENKDLMKGMPLSLIMKIEVRCDALMMYEKMTEEEKESAERAAKRLSTPEGRERIIDSIADGIFVFDDI